MYGKTRLLSRWPLRQNPNVTAGLIWAPEIGPRQMITMQTARPNVNDTANEDQPSAMDPHPMPTINAVPQNSAPTLFHTIKRRLERLICLSSVV